MIDEKPPSKRSRSIWTDLGDSLWSHAHFCFARLVLAPLWLLLIAFELIGSMIVMVGAGLIAGGIYGLYTYSGRSFTMWGILALGIALPAVYYKIQIDGDQRWRNRVNQLWDKWDEDRLARRDRDAADRDSAE